MVKSPTSAEYSGRTMRRKISLVFFYASKLRQQGPCVVDMPRTRRRAATDKNNIKYYCVSWTCSLGGKIADSAPPVSPNVSFVSVVCFLRERGASG